MSPEIYSSDELIIYERILTFTAPFLTNTNRLDGWPCFYKRVPLVIEQL